MNINLLQKIKNWTKAIMRQEVLFYAFLVALIIPNILLVFTESLTPLEQVCNIVFPLGCYYLIATITRRLGWGIWMLSIISILAGFQVVLLYIYERSVISTDMFLNFVTSDASESTELLSSLIYIVAITLIVYFFPMIIATIMLLKKRMLSKCFIIRNRIVAIPLAIIGLVLLIICGTSANTQSINTSIYPINAFYNLTEAVERYDKLVNSTSTSADFKFDATSSHPVEQREIYIVVIGETARAHNWELLGYNRPTNPELKKLENIVAFDSVLTESNITHKCVPMLVSSASAKDYDNIYKQKSIITAFKEAGFSTAFFSTQAHTQTLIDFFGTEADEYEYIRERSTDESYNPLDSELVTCAKNIIEKGANKQLIVLHTYGSHFQYAARYTEDFAYFLPDSPQTPDRKFLTELTNSYDNSIRFTDKVLSDLISILDDVENAHTSLLYVSDHGEDLFDYGSTRIFHSSTAPSYQQLHVPMVIWLSNEYVASYPQVLEALKNNSHAQISSSASFFNTVLNVAGIETPFSDETYAVSSKSFVEYPRLYLNDHYQGVPLMNMDMRDYDKDLLRPFAE